MIVLTRRREVAISVIIEKAVEPMGTLYSVHPAVYENYRDGAFDFTRAAVRY